MEQHNGIHVYATPEAEQPATKHRRSLGTLLSNLAQETATLAQQEVALARAEMSAKVSQMGTGLATLILGGLVLFAGLLKLLDAAIYGIAQWLAPAQGPWLAAVLVGGVVAIIGLILFLTGRQKLQPRHLAPERTIASLQRDKDVLKEHV